MGRYENAPHAQPAPGSAGGTALIRRHRGLEIELQAMTDRWAVVDWLKRGVPYREIHRATGVSVTTIGRVARFLANGNGGYVLAAQRLEETKRSPETPRHG
jgi:DNA invertase Pin-like site-specific DNA recombinase